MNRCFRVSVAFLLCAVSWTPVATAPQPDEDGRGPAAKDWTQYGGDWTSARFSTLTGITADNVKTLGAAWS